MYKLYICILIGMVGKLNYLDLKKFFGDIKLNVKKYICILYLVLMKIFFISEFGKRLLFLLDVSVFFMYLVFLYISKFSYFNI